MISSLQNIVENFHLGSLLTASDITAGLVQIC